MGKMRGRVRYFFLLGIAELFLTKAALASPEQLLIGVAGATEEIADSKAISDEDALEVVSEESAFEASSEETPDEREQEETWSLILVNAQQPIPEDYQIPELTELSGGNAVDSRIYPQLQRMFDDARAQGIYPFITSSYRTMEKQQELMDQKIQEYLSAGYSQAEAEELAGEWVALPGTSEHQMGLSVDISSDEASGQEAGAVWYWLQENCWKYGFIRRYPEDKTQITGIIHEPWHYRYVGVRAATVMYEQNLCLEEYLDRQAVDNPSGSR